MASGYILLQCHSWSLGDWLTGSIHSSIYPCFDTAELLHWTGTPLCISESGGCVCVCVRTLTGLGMLVCSMDGTVAYLDFSLDELGDPLSEEEKVRHTSDILTRSAPLTVRLQHSRKRIISPDEPKQMNS